MPCDCKPLITPFASSCISFTWYGIFVTMYIKSEVYIFLQIVITKDKTILLKCKTVFFFFFA